MVPLRQSEYLEIKKLSAFSDVMATSWEGGFLTGSIPQRALRWPSSPAKRLHFWGSRLYLDERSYHLISSPPVRRRRLWFSAIRHGSSGSTATRTSSARRF